MVETPKTHWNSLPVNRSTHPRSPQTVQPSPTSPITVSRCLLPARPRGSLVRRPPFPFRRSPAPRASAASRACPPNILTRTSTPLPQPSPPHPHPQQLHFTFNQYHSLQHLQQSKDYLQRLPFNTNPTSTHNSQPKCLPLPHQRRLPPRRPPRPSPLDPATVSVFSLLEVS